MSLFFEQFFSAIAIGVMVDIQKFCSQAFISLGQLVGFIDIIFFQGFFDSGEIESTTILVNLGQPADAVERLRNAGLSVTVEDGRAILEEPFPGTPYFESLGKSFDYYGDEPVQIAEIREPADRIAKEVFYIPAVLLLALIIVLQRRRMREDQGPEVEATA